MPKSQRLEARNHNHMAEKEERRKGEDRSHKAVANRIARKFGTEYPAAKGADVQSRRATVEVENPKTVSEALHNSRDIAPPSILRGQTGKLSRMHWKPQKARRSASIDKQGNTVKPSTRKHKRLGLSAQEVPSSLMSYQERGKERNRTGRILPVSANLITFHNHFSSFLPRNVPAFSNE